MATEWQNSLLEGFQHMLYCGGKHNDEFDFLSQKGLSLPRSFVREIVSVREKSMFMC